MFFHATGVHRDRLTNAVDWVGKEISPHIFMFIISIGVFVGSLTRNNAAVSRIGIPANVKIGDKSPRVPIRSGGLVDVDDRTVIVHPDQFPTAAIVIANPAPI